MTIRNAKVMDKSMANYQHRNAQTEGFG